MNKFADMEKTLIGKALYITVGKEKNWYSLSEFGINEHFLNLHELEHVNKHSKEIAHFKKNIGKIVCIKLDAITSMEIFNGNNITH